jgi:hypothetical protein
MYEHRMQVVENPDKKNEVIEYENERIVKRAQEKRLAKAAEDAL